jgi:hypothetical protein
MSPAHDMREDYDFGTRYNAMGRVNFILPPPLDESGDKKNMNTLTIIEIIFCMQL